MNYLKNMILFHKNTKINVLETKEVSPKKSLYTQTFKTDENGNKFYYQGEIKYIEGNPTWHGYGKMWTDYFTYNGEFELGKPHGYGIYKYIGNLYLYDFPSEFVKLYKGNFKNGKKHGKGLEIYKNNESYEGDFEKSLRHGEGVYYSSNGSEKIKGSWQQGSAINTTQITEFWENGNIKYKGGFNGSHWEGKGVFCYPNGSIYFEGTFSKNRLCYGKIYSKNNIVKISGDFTSNIGDKDFYYDNGERYIEYKHPQLRLFYDCGKLSYEGEIYDFHILNIQHKDLLEETYDDFIINQKELRIPYKKGKNYFFQESSVNNPKLQNIVEYDHTSSVLIGNYKEFFKNGILKKQLTYKNGFENGPYKEYYPSGNIKIDAIMENGRFIGSYNEYNENEYLIKSGKYVLDENNYILTNAKISSNDKKLVYEGDINNNGKYIGSGKIYYNNENNSLKYSGEFNNSGNYHGQGTLYYPNNNFSYQGDWYNGRRHGQGTSFYESTGTMEYLGAWVNDERHGSGTLFSESGEQVFAGNFHYNEIQMESMENN